MNKKITRVEKLEKVFIITDKNEELIIDVKRTSQKFIDYNVFDEKSTEKCRELDKHYRSELKKEAITSQTENAVKKLATKKKK